MNIGKSEVDWHHHIRIAHMNKARVSYRDSTIIKQKITPTIHSPDVVDKRVGVPNE